MPTNLYELRDQVLALDAEERANLLSLIARKSAAAPFIPDRNDSELWDIIARLCPPGSVHHKLTSFVGDERTGVTKGVWAAAVTELTNFVAQAQPVRHPQQDQTALLELVLDALVNDMLVRRIEITPKTILAALPRLRVAVDNCYPGYLAAKMLHMLIRVSA